MHYQNGKGIIGFLSLKESGNGRKRSWRSEAESESGDAGSRSWIQGDGGQWAGKFGLHWKPPGTVTRPLDFRPS